MADENPGLRVGDVVYLNSSRPVPLFNFAPWMTVTAVEDGRARVVWFDQLGVLHEGSFPVDCLSRME